MQSLVQRDVPGGGGVCGASQCGLLNRQKSAACLPCKHSLASLPIAPLQNYGSSHICARTSPAPEGGLMIGMIHPGQRQVHRKGQAWIEASQGGLWGRPMGRFSSRGLDLMGCLLIVDGRLHTPSLLYPMQASQAGFCSQTAGSNADRREPGDKATLALEVQSVPPLLVDAKQMGWPLKRQPVHLIFDLPRGSQRAGN